MSKRTLKPVELDLDAPGKDISHLFASSLSSAPAARQPESIHIDRLLDNPYQPRTGMNEESLEELARVIGGQGFQGVLVARPHPERRGYYQLTAGHRRREAAKRAGLAALPIVVQELADEEMVTLAVTENIQRDDLTPLEEGRIYLLMNREMGYKLEQIAREIGKTIGYVYNRLRVAKAPPDVQALVDAKPDSLRAVANLIKVESEEERAEIIEGLIAGSITTDDIPLYIRNLNSVPEAVSVDHGFATTNQSPGDPQGASSFDWAAPVTEALSPSDVAPEQSQAKLPGIEDTLSKKNDDASTGSPIQSQPSIVLIDGVETPVERGSALSDMADVYKRSDPLYAADVERATEQRRLSRARHSKLTRILSMLQAFSDGVEDANSLSREERFDLAIISLFTDRLCERLGIDKNNV